MWKSRKNRGKFTVTTLKKELSSLGVIRNKIRVRTAAAKQMAALSVNEP